jgi:hypothetical protein
MTIDASGSRRKTLLHSSMTGMRIIFNYKVMLMRQLIHFIFQAFFSHNYFGVKADLFEENGTK